MVVSNGRGGGCGYATSEVQCDSAHHVHVTRDVGT